MCNFHVSIGAPVCRLLHCVGLQVHGSLATPAPQLNTVMAPVYLEVLQYVFKLSEDVAYSRFCKEDNVNHAQ